VFADEVLKMDSSSGGLVNGWSSPLLADVILADVEEASTIHANEVLGLERIKRGD
jgi:hypothetical protein